MFTADVFQWFYVEDIETKSFPNLYQIASVSESLVPTTAGSQNL